MIAKLQNFRALAAGTLAVLALAGCADKANPDNVDRRSVERWNHLIAHEAEKAYDYLTPGFRATQTRDAYAAAMNNRAVQWKAAKFKEKTCEAERCTVQIDVTYIVTAPGMGGRPMESTSTQSETWIYSKGDWYFLPK
ncbi:hypothetical protein [Dokdonella sp.]|uniref:hypothetical protein n=1 Tax=Dokdonella sp. TaxID=2291710 RepID=UPI002F41E884